MMSLILEEKSTTITLLEQHISLLYSKSFPYTHRQVWPLPFIQKILFIIGEDYYKTRTGPNIEIKGLWKPSNHGYRYITGPSSVTSQNYGRGTTKIVRVRIPGSVKLWKSCKTIYSRNIYNQDWTILWKAKKKKPKKQKQINNPNILWGPTYRWRTIIN